MPKPRESRCCGRWTFLKYHLWLHTSLPHILTMFSFLSVGQVLIWDNKDRDNFLLIWKIKCETQSRENKKTTLLWYLWKLTQHLCLDLLLQIVGKEKAERRRKMYKGNFKNAFASDPKGWRHQKEGDSTSNLPGDWWKQSFLTQGEHLDLISGNSEISKLNQIPAIFVIFTSFSSSSSHFWFPWEDHQEQTRRAQPTAGATHPEGLGGPDLNCEIELQKLQAEGKAQNPELVNLLPERREKTWWRVWRAYYNL